MKVIRVVPRAPVFLLAIALLVGCGIMGCSDDNATQPPREFAPPTNLSAINGNEHIVVHWASSPDEGLDEFKQYNIYRGTSSLLDIDAGQLEQRGHKIGSVAAGIDSFQVTVANGTLYYFHIRAEKDSGENRNSRPGDPKE